MSEKQSNDLRRRNATISAEVGKLRRETDSKVRQYVNRASETGRFLLSREVIRKG